MWEVKRHGGRVSDVYRLVVESLYEEKARKAYEREKMRLRQGSVILLHDGKIINEARAPTLRRRW